MVPCELTKKKIIIWKCHLLLFYPITRNCFSIRLWRATKSVFYTTTSNNQLSGWMEKKLQITYQSQTCTKKRSQSLFGGLLPVWSTIAFWILVKAIHLRSMLSTSRCTRNCNARSQHWSKERAQFFSTTMPTQPALQRLNKVGYEVLLHPPYSPDLSPTDYHLFKHLNNFLQRKCFHNLQYAQSAF